MKQQLLNSIGLAFSLLLMAATVFTYLAPHLGWRVGSIRSNSMAPILQRGTLIVARSVNPAAVAVGDIIIFQPTTVGENPICHRVISVEYASPLQFRTKGDADATRDPFVVPARNLMGRVSFSAPRLGYVAQFLKTGPGLLLTLIIPGLIIFRMCLDDIRRELAQKKRKTPHEEAGE